MANWNRLPPGEVCYICGNKAEKRDRDIKRNWTGKYVCSNHYMVDYNRDIRKIDQNSRNNFLKAISNRRTNNLNPNSTQAKGDKFEELTCRWREVKNLNIENDNYRNSLDHSRDPELGIIQTQGRFYNSIAGTWPSFVTYRDWHKEFHNLICYCVSEDGKNIERVYIFPKEETIKRKYISITKNPRNYGDPWYAKYRINENIIRHLNDIWKEICHE